LDSQEKRFEYIQLHDLKKVIIASWPAFQEVFSTKERFSSQADEFVGLRNAFRGHPREIDDVQRKLGHGAMIWINQCIDSFTQLDNQVSESIDDANVENDIE